MSTRPSPPAASVRIHRAKIENAGKQSDAQKLKARFRHKLQGSKARSSSRKTDAAGIRAPDARVEVQPVGQQVTHPSSAFPSRGRATSLMDLGVGKARHPEQDPAVQPVLRPSRRLLNMRFSPIERNSATPTAPYAHLPLLPQSTLHTRSIPQPSVRPDPSPRAPARQAYKLPPAPLASSLPSANSPRTGQSGFRQRPPAPEAVLHPPPAFDRGSHHQPPVSASRHTAKPVIAEHGSRQLVSFDTQVQPGIERQPSVGSVGRWPTTPLGSTVFRPVDPRHSSANSRVRDRIASDHRHAASPSQPPRRHLDDTTDDTIRRPVLASMHGDSAGQNGLPRLVPIPPPLLHDDALPISGSQRLFEDRTWTWPTLGSLPPLKTLASAVALDPTVPYSSSSDMQHGSSSIPGDRGRLHLPTYDGAATSSHQTASALFGPVVLNRIRDTGLALDVSSDIYQPNMPAADLTTSSPSQRLAFPDLPPDSAPDLQHTPDIRAIRGQQAQCNACGCWVLQVNMPTHVTKKCRKLAKKEDSKYWMYVEEDDDDQGQDHYDH